MKILHCVDHYMPEHMAGTEVYIHTLASLQIRSGHDAAVLIPHFEFYRPGRFQEHYQYDGIDVYEYREPSEPLNRNILSGAEKPAGLINFTEFIRSHQPDVIHFHELTRSIGLGTAHVKAAKSFGAKVILTMHLSIYTCNTNTLIRDNKLCSGNIREFDCSVCCYKTLLKLPAIVANPTAALSVLSDAIGLSRKLPPGRLTTLVSMAPAIRRIKDELRELVEYTDLLVCLTEWYREILIKNGVPAEKIAVIPQALASNAGGPPPIKHSPGGLPLKVAFVGRIQPQKGVDLLIEAAKDFTPLELRVDLYGKEEDSDFYRQCMAALSNSGTVTFQGMLERGTVVSVLAGYDILCLPSTFSEMSSLVIQEAFAAGIPVLASRVYGNMEQVKDGHNGLLFDFRSSKDLKAKLAKLISEPGFLQRLRENVRPPGSFDKVNSAYLQLYTHLEVDIS